MTISGLNWPGRVLLSGVAFACLAGRAETAESRLALSIRSKPYAEALIDLAVQANVSILGTSACGAGGRVGLSGRYTLSEALGRLLADAPCQFRVIDLGTVRILPRAPAPTPAAPEAPGPPAVVSEVVVTATKRPADLQKVAAGISIVSRDQAQLTGAHDVGQTIGQIAGVITTNLGPGRDKFLIRGLSDGAFTGRTRSTVSTYLDNAPINYNAPDPDLRLVDIEQIEVVRGPQGALYGSGAVAGIYRIVTRRPDLADVTASVQGGLADTAGGDVSREVEGYLNLPLIPDRLAVRLVGYDDRLGGYLDNVNLRLTDVDQTRRNGGRLAARLQLSEGWEIDALAAKQNLRSNDTQYVVGLSQAGRTNRRIRETHNNDFAYGGLTLRGRFGWGELTSSSAFVHHVYASEYDASASEALTSLFSAQREDLGVYAERARVDMWVQDIVLRSPSGAPLEWLVGAFASRTVEETPSSLTILSAANPGVSLAAPAYTEFRKDRLTEYALYGEVSYAFAPAWRATFGGRAFQSRVHTTADIFVRQPIGSRDFDHARTFDGLAAKVALQREFKNGDLVYGLISEGYRPGGFNSGGFLPIRGARTTFAPDRLRNYELGVKARRLDGRLNLRAAAYFGDWADIQTDQYRPSGLAYTANVADARIAGLEFELIYDLPSGFGLQLNGLLSDSRVRRPNPDFAALVADDLPGVPNLSGGVLVTYGTDLGDGFRLRLAGQTNYVGHSALSFNATTSPRVGGYYRAQLAADLTKGRWRASVFTTNPLNDNSDTFAYGNPFSFGQIRQVTPQRPRTIGARLSATF